ncbi:DUF397 domain-containing protein [Nocardia iowensis]|uniref:DUF397 domain-containing protein n=1 Tax=Nocardia iowensis TaxID=204891 RepID=A0ABX8RNF8_NOCIO|nr:DUF397 domain-containing protein [Nocardia iowensis]QXN91169.1 DUF397 domain-containing protein [Nocardia iowensis]
MSSADQVSTGTGWFKSSHSGDTQTCVEVRFDGDRVLVRDSKYQGSRASQPILTFTNAAWSVFIAHL